MKQRVVILLAIAEFVLLVIVLGIALNSSTVGDQTARAAWRREIQTSSSLAQALREVGSGGPGVTAAAATARALAATEMWPLTTDDVSGTIAGIATNVQLRLDHVLRGDGAAMVGLEAYASTMAETFDLVTQVAQLRAFGQAVPDRIRLRLFEAVNRSAATASSRTCLAMTSRASGIS